MNTFIIINQLVFFFNVACIVIIITILIIFYSIRYRNYYCLEKLLIVDLL